MKEKITLAVLAALFVVASSFAQRKTFGLPLEQKQVSVTIDGKNAKKQPAKKLLQMQQSGLQQQGLRAALTSHAKKMGKDLTKKHQPAAQRRSAADVIDEQPEGTLVNYERSGDAYGAGWFGLYREELAGVVGSVVFGADNKVYFKNIISQAGLNTWIEGTISGSTITINFPQTVYVSADGDVLDVAKMNVNDAGTTYVCSDEQTVKLNYNAATGAITVPNGNLKSGYEIIGLCYEEDHAWAGYGDWNISYTKVADALVEAPEGLTTETYSLTANGYVGSLVKVGFDGNDVYVQGIDSNLPKTWVKGTINGNKVTFKSGQYVGADEFVGYHQYLIAATAEEKYDDYYEEYYTEYTLTDDDITFDYDAATKTLSNSSTFLLNAGKTDVNYLATFDKARMAKFVEVAATPAAPEIELSEGGTDYYLSGYGWGSVYVNKETTDVDGNYILPEKTSYRLWVRVNGEEKPLTFSSYDYANQEEETMEEIPFDYSDNWDIGDSGNNKYIYYYVIGPEAYGVQIIYRGAGEKRYSEIAWADVEGIGAEVQPAAATPAYPDATISETDNRIGYGFYTGNEDISEATNNYKPETYDVAVKYDHPALVGSLIESITFPLQEVEGVSNINVFLTSQLRVENGKNAADLVVKSVTPDEAGFVTVKLDKPYTIPEGGVYVGYSLTVDELSTINETPIAVIKNYNYGGLYMHTSDGFLKWLDFGEVFGASAMIQIQVAGSNINQNAAGFASVEKQYVKTGEAIKVPVNIVNYGSKGVTSLDIQYSVAGQTGSRHIDADVDAFFAKQATVELNLPAIAQRGNYELSLTIDKVNGVANEADAQTKLPVIVLNSVPKHRALLEEYTGTWCGYCPRGYVGLEKLAELYPDDYVLVSYHNGDDMEIMQSKYFPSPVEGFPDAWIDRVVETDAYYGKNYGVKDLGIADEMAERSKTFGHASIGLTVALSNDEKKVDVNSTVTFPYDVTGGTFALEYILTADGLTDESWGQSNYYAGGSMGYPAYMDTFTKTADEEVYGLVYNDVAVLTSKIGGIKNSIPATAAADQALTHSYSFNLANAVNTAGDNVIQDKSKLKVVALLVDTATGEVVNAIKAKVNSTAGISIVEAGNGTKGKAAYYDLSGRRIEKPAKGLYIVNGRKVVIK